MPPIIKQGILIASITPYFLEKGYFWFKENLKQILEAGKTQSFFEDNIIYLEKDQDINLSQLLRKIDEMGYEKVQKIDNPGEFSQKGGVIDIFPINQSQAVRLDFLGNKIDSIELLDIRAEEERARDFLKKKLKKQKLFSDLKGLKPGDYLVHLDHGVGIYSQQTAIKDQKYYQLQYAAGDKLYVPVDLERKLSRYIGFIEPKISRLGSSLWQKIKGKIKEKAENFAKELLAVYANREITSRPPYLPNDEIDAQLASSFLFEETPDQKETIEDIKEDLEKTTPMDRLVCGDVGFGKTEVALRAMIKVVKSGYLAVLICPTTILAHQHYQNFKSRLHNFPVSIALLSRIQSKKEQKNIIQNLEKGKIDILIGTHRILSKDITPFLFQKEIGLLVIDDEQKFGVRQKEKLKEIRTKIDILSLSATPIPRTLHLALSSLKNISIIQTPPLGRIPVKTCVSRYSDELIKKAIEKEIKRGGQIYYLHNRIETIEAAKKSLEILTPKTKIRTAHGKLGEKELIRAMEDFRTKKFNLLLATTIIENGLDLPAVNTLIVDDAARLGLSQAYQIRGRVGRSHTQAFAYFLHGKRLSPNAKLRLKALQETNTLGSGYKIALKDLEIRGAGNILGKEQSGNINKIGLNLYCQMLSEAVEKLRQEKSPSFIERL